MDCRIAGPLLSCRGLVQPYDLGAQYRIEIEYRLGSWPKVWVQDPPLSPRPGAETIPHVYPGPRPCLFYRDEWRPNMPLVTSILPWLYRWLFHYEAWHVTGTWAGGGIDHGPAGPADARSPDPKREGA
jgi:hypothetical protein